MKEVESIHLSRRLIEYIMIHPYDNTMSIYNLVLGNTFIIPMMLWLGPYYNKIYKLYFTNFNIKYE